MSQLEMVNANVRQASKALELGSRVEKLILNPNREVKVEGGEILQRRGTPLVPDILANAGGVTVSYFEWVPNVQQFRWDGERVNHELRTLMAKAYRDVSQLAKICNLSWRTATYVLALERVAKATFLPGVQ